MTCGSLFSGAGMGDLGLTRAGFDHRWFVEVDPWRRRLLAKRWPGVPQYSDIREVTGHELEQVDLIAGGFPCFPAGTLVKTASGYVPIEDVCAGDLVSTHKGRKRSVIRTMCRKNAPIIEVKAMGSPPVRTTSEHPFYVRRRFKTWNAKRHAYDRHFSEPQWVLARDLTKDCFLAQPINRVLSSTTAGDVPFWRLVGRYLGDGWLVNHKRSSLIPQGHRGSRVDSRVWKAIICCAPEEEDDLRKIIAEAGFHGTLSREQTVVKFHISSRGLVEFLLPFGRGAAQKTVPGFVFGLSRDQQQALFEGWASADGSDYEGGTRVSTVSKKLAIGMAQVARNAYGVAVSVTTTASRGPGAIDGRTVNQRRSYEVKVSRVNRVAFVDGDIAWVPLWSVATTNEQTTVWNLEVEEDNSYVADGFIVHNCTDISPAGKGRGIWGPQSRLWFDMLRIVRVVRPRYVLVENSSALLGRGMLDVLGGLAESGYDAEWQIVRAADVGAPHERARVWIVAYALRQ